MASVCISTLQLGYPVPQISSVDDLDADSYSHDHIQPDLNGNTTQSPAFSLSQIRASAMASA